jgi:hypothetical protein
LTPFFKKNKKFLKKLVILEKGDMLVYRGIRPGGDGRGIMMIPVIVVFGLACMAMYLFPKD